MDLDPRYVDVTVKRWERFTGLESVHFGSGGVGISSIHLSKIVFSSMIVNQSLNAGIFSSPSKTAFVFANLSFVPGTSGNPSGLLAKGPTKAVSALSIFLYPPSFLTAS